MKISPKSANSAKRQPLPSHPIEAVGLMPLEIFGLMAAAFYPLTCCPEVGWRAVRHPDWGEYTAVPIIPDAIINRLLDRGLLREVPGLGWGMTREPFCIGTAAKATFDGASYIATTEQGLRALGSYSEELLALALEEVSVALVDNLRKLWKETGIEAVAPFRQAVSSRSQAWRGTRRLARSSRRRRSRRARSVPTGRSRGRDGRSAPSNRRAGSGGPVSGRK